MKKLEIIQLRLAGKLRTALVNDIRRSILAGVAPETVQLYFHATVPSDLSVHIHSESSADIKETSELGVRLAAALREYGMVQHTVWLEDQNREYYRC